MAPLRCYSVGDISQLLYGLCVSPLDVQALRRANIDGVAIQGLASYTMEMHLGLSNSAVHTVAMVQRASRLFDCIARFGTQSRLSELDCRVWLTGKGLAASAINRLADKFRVLSAAGDGMVSFAELAANYEWFDSALKCVGAHL